MINKEDIEKAKERISKSLKDVLFSTLYSQEENEKDEIILLSYIEQLETKREKIIEKLEEESNQFDKETKEIAIEMNKARDFVITDEYEEAENEEYILYLEEKYEKLNIKRIRTKEILQIVKGEEE